MGFDLTLALLAAAIGLAVVCAWRGARAPDPRRGPRLAPYRLMMAVFAALALLLAAHLAGLLEVVKKQG